MKVDLRFFFLFLVPVILSGCDQSHTPKPRGYFRIDFPEKKYEAHQSDECPYRFEIPQYAMVVKDTIGLREPCWVDVNFPRYKAQLHLSYKSLNEDLEKYMEDSRTLVTKHISRADGIEEIPINNGRGVYGTLYDIKGNAASSVQFFVTDSTDHFIRAALYFRTKPNKDSLAPVLEYLKMDISHMLNTFEWD